MSTSVRRSGLGRVLRSFPSLSITRWNESLSLEEEDKEKVSEEESEKESEEKEEESTCTSRSLSSARNSSSSQSSLWSLMRRPAATTMRTTMTTTTTTTTTTSGAKIAAGCESSGGGGGGVGHGGSVSPVSVADVPAPLFYDAPSAASYVVAAAAEAEAESSPCATPAFAFFDARDEYDNDDDKGNGNGNSDDGGVRFMSPRTHDAFDDGTLGGVRSPWQPTTTTTTTRHVLFGGDEYGNDIGNGDDEGDNIGTPSTRSFDASDNDTDADNGNGNGNTRERRKRASDARNDASNASRADMSNDDPIYSRNTNRDQGGGATLFPASDAAIPLTELNVDDQGFVIVQNGPILPPTTPTTAPSNQTAETVRRRNDVPTDLTVGGHVVIIGGTHKGKVGIVKKLNNTRHCIDIDGVGERNISKDFVTLRPTDVVSDAGVDNVGGCMHQDTCVQGKEIKRGIGNVDMNERRNAANNGRGANSIQSVTDNNEKTAVTAANHDHDHDYDHHDLTVGELVLITKKRYQNKIATVLKVNNKSYRVHIHNVGIHRIEKRHVRRHDRPWHDCQNSLNQDGTTFENQQPVSEEMVVSVAATATKTTASTTTTKFTNNSIGHCRCDNVHAEDEEKFDVDASLYGAMDTSRVRRPSSSISIRDVEEEEEVVAESEPRRRQTRQRLPQRSRQSQGSRELNSSSSSTTTTTTLMSDRIDLGRIWSVPDSDKGGSKWGDRYIVKFRAASEKRGNDTTNFLSVLLGNRMQIIDVPLNKNELQTPFPKREVDHGSTYQLVSIKIQKDGDESSNCSNSSSYLCCRKPLRAQLVYAQVSGPGLADIHIKDVLERLADFTSLTTRKAVARLELLQSPACKITSLKERKDRVGMFGLKSKDFAFVQDRGYAGCGFICEDFLVNRLLGGGAEAKRTIATQTRIIVVIGGIFKGMLMRKKIKSGPPIQLPSSMLKVKPSKHPDALSDDRAFLLITRTGKHQNKTNHFIGRLLDPSKVPPPKSFMIKPLARDGRDMIPRLWTELGVPREVVDEYVVKSTMREHLRHAYVVGVADPTDMIPPGHVYVTGMNAEHERRRRRMDDGDDHGHGHDHRDRLFVTRSPCIKASDGRMVPAVTTKPRCMTEEQWEWLGRLEFGAVIFGNPNPGMAPLPELIAKGDLDGDLYFLCWSQEIIRHIRADPIVDVPIVNISEDEVRGVGGDEKVEGRGMDDDWFERATQMMIDSASDRGMNELIGKLYNLALEFGDKSSMGIRDSDAEAFADAYYQALDFGKHGGSVILPGHLHSQLPDRLRRYLTWS